MLLSSSASKLFPIILFLLLGILSLVGLLTTISTTKSFLRRNDIVFVKTSENYLFDDHTNSNTKDCLSRIGTIGGGIKLYSQNDEDGAILQTLRCMGGHGSKEFFEFGSESGIQVNTRLLRELYGWHGHYLDGGFENPFINLHQEYFTPTNIVSLMTKYNASKTMDILSVDTDYDDFWITREILLAGYKPRVLVNEYNANFGSEWSVSTIAKPIGQEGNVRWQLDCYFGASGMAMVTLAKEFGYTPVFSNDVNIIFVRLDQALELGMGIPAVENFPGPYAWALHKNCDRREWKVIDVDTVRRLARNPDISHISFADSFQNVTLATKEYGVGGSYDRTKWRTFSKVDIDGSYASRKLLKLEVKEWPQPNNEESALIRVL